MNHWPFTQLYEKPARLEFSWWLETLLFVWIVLMLCSCAAPKPNLPPIPHLTAKQQAAFNRAATLAPAAIQPPSNGERLSAGRASAMLATNALTDATGQPVRKLWPSPHVSANTISIQESSVAPVEIPLPGLGAATVTPGLSASAGLTALAHEDRVLIFDEAGRTADLALGHNFYAGSDQSVLLDGDALVVCARKINVPPVPSSNVVMEFKLAGFTNGLPSRADFVASVYFAREGRGSALVKGNNSIAAFVVRHEGYYNVSSASRSNATGQWTRCEVNYTNDTVLGSFEVKAFLGNDGRYYVLVMCDGSGKIALSRWNDAATVTPHDFKPDYLSQGSGDLAPDVERPQLMIAAQDGSAVISYQPVAGSQNGCAMWGNRITHFDIALLETFPPMPPPRISSFQFDYQNLYLRHEYDPTFDYDVFASEKPETDLGNWLAVGTIWGESVADGWRSVGAVNPLYKIGNYPLRSAFLTVRARNYRTTLVAVLPQWYERANTFVPVIRTAAGYSYRCAPIADLETCDFSQWFIGTISGDGALAQISPTADELLAWGNPSPGYNVVVRRGGVCYLSKWQ